MTAPRGPMCQIAHHGPCWRDHTFAGFIPRRVYDDAAALADIEKDRAANARRCGERCVEIKPPPPLPDSEEGVNVLDEEAHDMAQWPAGSFDVERETVPTTPPATSRS